MQPTAEKWSVADLFSCGGGTSSGFARRPEFQIVGAVDLELAKPSGGVGASGCNATYLENLGIEPHSRDIMTFSPSEFSRLSGFEKGDLSVLISCAPCTDFTRTKPTNHSLDTQQNSLVGRSADFVEELLPEIVFMENARELINGKFKHHHDDFCQRLRGLGYDVKSEIHLLSKFGLPQSRERAIIAASRIGPIKTLSDLWDGRRLSEAVTVRSALSRLAAWQALGQADPYGESYSGMTDAVRDRIHATPKDGGSWIDLARDPQKRTLLTPDCLNRWESGRHGSHPDVYGRMWWDRPAPTIKRECGHVGNGRYTHPVEDRLLTVREMATLQGFPFDYRFISLSISNRYRHIGDAVPPLIAYQLSALAKWMKTGIRPSISDMVMPNTCLSIADIFETASSSR